MLCVNLQTSFMHPPFGFALFYLRGVAPKEVKSSDIYWGAIPWVVLQLILVALVIAFPKQVTMLLDKAVDYDLDKVKIEMPTQETPGDEDLTKGLERARDQEVNGTLRPTCALSGKRTEVRACARREFRRR